MPVSIHSTGKKQIAVHQESILQPQHPGGESSNLQMNIARRGYRVADCVKKNDNNNITRETKDLTLVLLRSIF